MSAISGRSSPSSTSASWASACGVQFEIMRDGALDVGDALARGFELRLAAGLFFARGAHRVEGGARGAIGLGETRFRRARVSAASRARGLGRFDRVHQRAARREKASGASPKRRMFLLRRRRAAPPARRCGPARDRGAPPRTGVRRSIAAAVCARARAFGRRECDRGPRLASRGALGRGAAAQILQQRRRERPAPQAGRAPASRSRASARPRRDWRACAPWLPSAESRAAICA